MSWAALALLVVLTIVFYELFVRMHVMTDVRRLFSIAPATLKIVASSAMSDTEKELAARRMSLAVLKDTLRFTTKFAAILLTCLMLAVVGQRVLSVPGDKFYSLLLSWPLLIALAVFVSLYARVRHG